jgi:hypothetical protein
VPVFTGVLIDVAGGEAVLLALGGAMAVVAGASTANRSLPGTPTR